MRTRVLLPLLGALVSFTPFPTLAADAGIELKATQEQLAKARKRAQDLAATASKLEEEQRDISQQLVRLSASVRNCEMGIADAEEKLSILTREADEKTQKLKAKRAELDAMVHAAVSLSQMPPEAAIMMPGNPTRILEAARAVHLMAESIRIKSAALNDELKELFALKQKVEESKTSLLQAQVELKQNQKLMNEKLKSRAELYAKANNERVEQQERTVQLAKKSEDLQALVAQLEAQRKAKEEAEAKAAAAANAEAKAKEKARQEARARNIRSFAKAKGELHIPVAGKFIKPFGSLNDRGEKRKGIVLEAKPGSQVSAPFDGEVVFTGPFLNYGKIIILRHSDDYHTLLAGFSSINTQTGQKILAGEPIGVMGTEKDNLQLYMELRKDNQPINPAPWIAGLSAEAE